MILAKLAARVLTVRAAVQRLRSNYSKRDGASRTMGTTPTRPHAPQPDPEAPTFAQTVPSGSPGPDSPIDFEAEDWKATLKRTMAEMKTDRVTLVAAGMTYYMFLAIFPALIAATGILGLMNIDTEPIVRSIRQAMPGGSGQVLIDAVRNADKPSEAASLFATILGIALALWAASSAFVALQSGLNVAYDVHRDRKFVGARAVAFGLLVATGVLGFTPGLLTALGDSFFWNVLGWVVTAACVMLLFSTFYFFGPKREGPSWHWVSLGGILGGVIWIAATIGFGFYAAEYASYGRTYGPFASIVVLILWLFITSLSILVGGELNAEVERQAEKRSGSRPGNEVGRV